jgi:membrane-associated phospholipid phosphatase
MKAFPIVCAVLFVSFLPQHVSAQAISGLDTSIPAWSPSERHTAAVLSDITVTASIAFDAWKSWRAAHHRKRPDGSDRKSFFSEHTAFAAAALGGSAGREFAITIPLTVGTGYFRIAADKHYLTDTLAGAIVGGLAGLIR